MTSTFDIVHDLPMPAGVETSRQDDAHTAHGIEGWTITRPDGAMFYIEQVSADASRLYGSDDEPVWTWVQIDSEHPSHVLDQGSGDEDAARQAVAAFTGAGHTDPVLAAVHHAGQLATAQRSVTEACERQLRAAAIQAHRAGHSVTSIAAAAGVSRKTLHKWMRAELDATPEADTAEDVTR